MKNPDRVHAVAAHEVALTFGQRARLIVECLPVVFSKSMDLVQRGAESCKIPGFILSYYGYGTRIPLCPREEPSSRWLAGRSTAGSSCGRA